MWMRILGGHVGHGQGHGHGHGQGHGQRHSSSRGLLAFGPIPILVGFECWISDIGKKSHPISNKY